MNNLGALLEDKFGDYDFAKECFEKAIECDPLDPIAHYNIGKLSEKHLKDFHKAKEHYEKAIELDPEVTIFICFIWVNYF